MSDGTVACALRDLARRVERLAPCRRDPERFHLERDAVAHALRRLAANPCAACPAADLERRNGALLWQPIETRARLAEVQQEAAYRALRHALEMGRAAVMCRRRRAAADPRQMPLPLPEPSA